MDVNGESQKINSGVIRKLVTELYTNDIAEISRINNGETNFVFFVSTFSRESDVVVRISLEQSKINDYIKEQWCIVHAKEAGIPVPVILEVSNHIVPYPYSVVKFKKGFVANNFEGEKEYIYKQIGEYTKKIHSIQTTNYGKVFDWSHNTLSKYKVWKEYFQNEYKVSQGLELAQHLAIFSNENFARLVKAVDEIQNWEFQPVLCHEDLQLKNILLNSKGKVTSILDWELAESHHPYRDIGKILRAADYERDREYWKHFLEGYGMSETEFRENKDVMIIFEIFNDLKSIKKVEEDLTDERLEKIRRIENSLFEDKFIHGSF
jgi:aminoglycoside phosphotransferase (APT) family kinase protein